MQSSTTSRAALVLALALGTVTAAGCSSQNSTTQAARSGAAGAPASTSGGTARPSEGSTAAAPPQAAAVTISPAAGAKGVEPTSPVAVSVAGGTLRSVTVTEKGGSAVEGKLEGRTWKPSHVLKADTTYTVNVDVSSEGGATQAASSTFTTIKPETVAKYVLQPMDDVVGVGMPAMISFNSAVTSPQAKAEVERNLKVTTTPAVNGSWGWLDDRRVMWRPESYWKPGTRVTVQAALNGVKTGEGKYVGRDDTESFTIGRAQVSTVDMVTHQMTVTRDGKVLKTIPVTTGKAGFVTRSGTKVIMEKVGHMTMDSETVGIPKGSSEYYKLDTEWNMRLTTTGEFLHAAPWSQWAQGKRNVSHGCTNMSLANANWMFQNSMVGDVVQFTGSKRPFLDDEGITVWQYSFADWQKKSALR